MANGKVSDLSQLKWVFDGKKVSQEELTTAIKDAIEKWKMPIKVKDRWVTKKLTEDAFKQKLLQIFKVE